MRTLALIALAALATLAFAQKYTALQYASVLANEIDAILTDCPAWAEGMDGDKACFEIDSSLDLAKTYMELAYGAFGDIHWAEPWTREDFGLARFSYTDYGDYLGVFLFDTDDYLTTVMISTIVVDEEGAE